MSISANRSSFLFQRIAIGYSRTRGQVIASLRRSLAGTRSTVRNRRSGERPVSYSPSLTLLRPLRQCRRIANRNTETDQKKASTACNVFHLQLWPTRTRHLIRKPPDKDTTGRTHSRPSIARGTAISVKQNVYHRLQLLETVSSSGEAKLERRTSD